LITEDKEVYLLTIFDKSEFDNIDEKILSKIIADLTENKGNVTNSGYPKFGHLGRLII